MAVVRNKFTHTMKSTETIQYQIPGLISENSKQTVAYVSTEASLYLLKAIYQTLIDAGYSDTTIDETDYSITVLGFKFYALVRANSTTFGYVCATTYTHHQQSSQSALQNYFSATAALNEEGGTDLSFTIIVRGDGKNAVIITLGSYSYRDNEVVLLTLAKAKNLLTSEDAFYFGDSPGSAGASVYLRNKNSLYECYESKIGTDCNLYWTNAGLNTTSKMICMPVFAYYGSFLIKGILQCNNVTLIIGKYYRVGDDIYYYYDTSLFIKVN